MKKRNHSVRLLCLFPILLGGCQSVEMPQQSSLLRIVDAATRAPTSDLLIGSSTVFTSVSAPFFSNYAPVDTGTSILTLRTAGTTSGGTQSSVQAVPGQQYSLLLMDTGAGYQDSLLVDQSISAPAGDVSLRFITNTPVAGALDVYLVPTGGKVADATPVLANAVSGTVTAYTNISTGDYDIIVTGAGKTVAKYTGTGMTFSSGQVRTLLFMDQKYTLPAAVSLIVGDDLN